MVKSRAEPVKPAATGSDSEDPQEETDGGSSTEGSESESENQTALAESGKKSEAEAESSSEEEEEEEEDGSESESGSESDGPDVNVQPLATKSANSGSAKPASKPEAEPATPSKPVSLKRAPGEVKESQAKKQKQPEVENSEKKQLFQRLWSEEDEIAVLKGMIEYAAKKKADPVADLNAFLEFIKKNIHIDVSRTQLQDKIRRLRKKYENNRGKEKDGKNRNFSKPHEQEAYELSKKVWNDESKLVGGSVANGGYSSKNKSIKKAVEEAAEGKDANFVSDLGDKTVPLIAGGGTLEERITRMGDEAFKGGQGGGSKLWNSLKVKEIELYMAQLDVKKAQANLVLDLLKS